MELIMPEKLIKLLNSHRHKNLFFLLIISICFIVFKDYILLKKLYIFLDIGSDTYNKFWPNYSHIANYLRSDGIPKWSFYTGMGQNIFPGGINDPFNLILYSLGDKYLPYGFIYVELLKITIGGMIFFNYLKILSLSKYTQIVGGLLFAFSGYMIIGGCWYGHATYVLYGAFLLFSFEKIFVEDIYIFFPAAVALIASNSVFYMYTFGLFLIIYGIFRFFR